MHTAFLEYEAFISDRIFRPDGLRSADPGMRNMYEKYVRYSWNKRVVNGRGGHFELDGFHQRHERKISIPYRVK